MGNRADTTRQRLYDAGSAKECDSVGDGDKQGDVAPIRILYTAEEIKEAVSKLALAVVANCTKPITLVPIMDAAIFLATDVMRIFAEYEGLGVYLCPMQIKTRHWDGTTTVAHLLTPIPENTDIVLVDTVIDTGETLGLALGQLPRMPKLIAAVVIKRDKCTDPVFQKQLEVYSCFFAKGDPWLVGYGLDDKGLYRELPYIGVMHETN